MQKRDEGLILADNAVQLESPAKTCSAKTMKLRDKSEENRASLKFGEVRGWGGRIRTYGTRYQKALPYRLATPQLRGCLRCSGAVIKAKKRRRIAFFGIRGGLAPSPVFIKDGFKKVTLLILLGFTRCLPTYALLALRPVDCRKADLPT